MRLRDARLARSRRPSLPICLALVIGLLAAGCSEIDPSVVAAVAACNATVNPVHLRIQVGYGTDVDAVTDAGSCETAYTVETERSSDVTYRVLAGDPTAYLAAIAARQAALKLELHGSAPAGQAWGDLVKTQDLLLGITDQGVGVACTGTVDKGDVVKVTISLNGDQLDCGGTVRVTPAPPSAAP